MHINVHFDNAEPPHLSDLLAQLTSQRTRYAWDPEGRVLRIEAIGRDPAADAIQKLLVGSGIEFERIEIHAGARFRGR